MKRLSKEAATNKDASQFKRLPLDDAANVYRAAMKFDSVNNNNARQSLYRDEMGKKIGNLMKKTYDVPGETEHLQKLADELKVTVDYGKVSNKSPLLKSMMKGTALPDPVKQLRRQIGIGGG